MKRLFAGGMLAFVAFAGAGCRSTTNVQTPVGVDVSAPATLIATSTIPVATSTVPTATTTKPVVKGVVPPPVGTHADWKTDALFSGWTIQHPNDAEKLDQNSDEAKNGLLLRVSLGSAVQNPGKKSVPDRKLEVWKLKQGDIRFTECDNSLVGKQNISEARPVKLKNDLIFCLQKSVGAAAGNLYNVQDYVLNTIEGPYAFTFTTHSVQCANYEHPDDQCIAYNEKRDTAVFSEIMETLTRK